MFCDIHAFSFFELNAKLVHVNLVDLNQIITD